MGASLVFLTVRHYFPRCAVQRPVDGGQVRGPGGRPSAAGAGPGCIPLPSILVYLPPLLFGSEHPPAGVYPCGRCEGRRPIRLSGLIR
jgi:hypothetical protein